MLAKRSLRTFLIKKNGTSQRKVYAVVKGLSDGRILAEAHVRASSGMEFQLHSGKVRARLKDEGILPREIFKTEEKFEAWRQAWEAEVIFLDEEAENKRLKET